MKKEERNFSQMVKEVIDHAKEQAKNNFKSYHEKPKQIDRNANIADEWLKGFDKKL